MIFCLNGKFIPASQAKVSVLDNGFLYGDGFYDTMRTYDGVVFELKAHLQRITWSAQQMALVLPWTTQTIGTWIKKISARNRLTDARIRVTVTRGMHGTTFGIERRPTLVIMCANIRNNTAIDRYGIRGCTMKLQRVWPEIKTLGLTAMILGKRYATQHAADEVIGISADGNVLEGVSTNIFIVKSNRVFTPKSRILPGLTRKRVLVLARKKNLPVLVKDLPKSALLSADEIFLTNRVREIIPVVRLNGKKVGSGRVGPITKRLMAAYREYVRKYVERHRSDV